MKDIEELALNVAKEMYWMQAPHQPDIIDFATRLIAAYIAEQEPVHQWRKRTDDRWFDASQEEAYSRVDQYYEARTLFTAPPRAPSEVVITTNEAGRWVAVTRQDEEGRILKVLWEAPPEPAPQQETVINTPVDPASPPAVCAAPSSEEVREMVERLRNMSQGVWPYKRAADMIERLAARVDDLKQANDGLATAGILPDGCVVVQRKVTEDGRCALATPGNYRTYQDQWNALIAAGEVKTC